MIVGQHACVEVAECGISVCSVASNCGKSRDRDVVRSPRRRGYLERAVICSVGAYLSFIFGGLQAMILLIRKKQQKGKTSHMAFGPALSLGMWVAMVWGNELIRWYFGLFV